MSIAYWIALICLGLIWLPWLARRVVIPAYHRQQTLRWINAHPEAKRITAAEKIIRQLYSNAYSYAVAASERRRYQLHQTRQFIYGEITFASLAQLLYFLKLDEHDVFYDLGCGSGQTVYSAALLHPFKKVCGIELLPGLCQIANERKNHFKQIAAEIPELTAVAHHIEFVEDDILNYDFSDATVVFINATCFEGLLWQNLVNKLINLAAHTKIIISSRVLPETYFDLLYSGKKTMSWGMCNVRIYQKHQSTSLQALNPAPGNHATLPPPSR